MQRLLGREVGGKQNILVLNDEAHHAYRIRQAAADDGRGGRGGARRGARGGSRVRVDGLDRRPRPHPQAPPDQLLRRPLGDAVLPRARRRRHEPDLPLGRERLRPDRRDRVGAREDPAARASRTRPGEEQAAYFNIWRWIMSKLTARRARRQAGEPEAGGGAAVRGAPDPAARAARGRSSASEWDGRRRGSGRRCSSSSARTRKLAGVIYEWLAEGKPPAGHPAGRTSPELRNDDGTSVHDPGRLEGDRARRRSRARRTTSTRWMRLHARHGRQARVAARRAGAAGLSRGLRGAREEARPAAPSAGPRRPLHRQRRDADRGLGLQHGHAHRRAAAVHVAAPLRAGRRPRAAPGELRARPRRGSSPRRSRRSSACRSRSSRSSSASGPKPPPRAAAPRPGAASRRRATRSGSRASRATSRRIRNRVTVDWDSIAPVAGRPDEDPGRGAC